MKTTSALKRRAAMCLLVPLGLVLMAGCDSALEGQAFSELSEDFLSTEEGVKSALNGTYQNFHDRRDMDYRMFIDVFEAGYGYNESGSFEGLYASAHEDFNWNSNDNMALDNWQHGYAIIREANIVLDALEKGEFDAALEERMKSEALAMRGYAYDFLYQFFGAVPIFISSNPDTDTKPRASEEEMLNRIESDLSEAIASLPIKQEEFGRITKGAALAMLTKHYLNTKQWQKVISTANQIIALNIYSLQPEYKDVFAYDNEQNSEIIYAFPGDVANAAHWPLMCLGIPTDFPLKPNQSTCAARLYAFDRFIESFSERDTRDDDLVRQYVNTSGETVQGFGRDKTLQMFKYGPDPNANGNSSGLDQILLRYADILLAKAEALNEVSGPNQESVALINRVRERADASSISLTDFSSKKGLRDFLFEERKRELYFEGKSREDLIRWGQYISQAQQRGLSAQDFHRLYPIPQSELDSNPNMEQNPGY